jgi:hypothetical protein
MANTFRYLSSTDGYMPLATNYVVSYIRRKEEFPVNRYCQLVQLPAPAAWYWKLDRDQSVRVRNVNDHLWADGADRPRNDDNHQGFTTVEIFTKRYDFTSRLGNQALAQANKQWEAKTAYLQMLASQAMVARTLTVITLLTAPASWPTTNTGDVNTINGGKGKWSTASDDPANVNYNAIRESLAAAVNICFLNTNGRVKYKDLCLVLSPNCARKVAASAEIHNYVRQTNYAREKLEDDEENLNDRFGLPSHLYGIRIVVEDTPYLADLPIAGSTDATPSPSRAFAMPDASPVLISRVGGIDAQVGPSFSTLQLGWFEDQMKVFEFDDPRNKLTEFHISDQYVPYLPAPESGFLFTNAI